MSKINETAVVKRQYEKTDRLNTRISIHDKYSTNKLGFGNWIFLNYKSFTDLKILELGCGTGAMWKSKGEQIALCSRLVLTDFSKAMVQEAKNNIGKHCKVEYSVADIQNIPYCDKTFDVVIANMMLYHVPDITKGLSEVKRVLKDDGCFYCATYGEHGIIEFLSKILSEYGVKDSINKNFTLQNGAEILGRVFSEVKRLDYQDSLAVTDMDDMVEYIYSLSDMTALTDVPKDVIKEVLTQNTTNGVLNVPKEYGMFVAS